MVVQMPNRQQDVIADLPSEQTDDQLLADMQRRELIQDGIDGMAQLLYRIRAAWIGGMCIPWGLLTPGQKAGYRAEVDALVKEIK